MGSKLWRQLFFLAHSGQADGFVGGGDLRQGWHPDDFQNFFNQLRGTYQVLVSAIKSQTRRDAVAQGIFKDMSINMELRQFYGTVILNANGSAFSDEDLLSNYLGFLNGYHRVPIDNIEFSCEVVDDIEENLCLYKKLGGLGKNINWQKPKDYNSEYEEVLMEKGEIRVIGPMVFPFQLRKPWENGGSVFHGYAWRYWNHL